MAGIGVNIIAAYHFICLNYEQGDEIILIGYSRGAFTVRCVINLVHETGLLTRSGLSNLHSVLDGWWNNESHDEIARKIGIDDQSMASQWHPRPQRIKACGLWDTVNSVGRLGIFGPDSIIPWIVRDGAPSRVTNSNIIGGVDNIFHALSLHECRALFQPVMASVPDDAGHVDSEQCWFSGYHGDIGGGRPDDVLAHLSLVWMMAKLDRIIDFDKDLFSKQSELVSSLQGVILRSAGESGPTH